MKTVMMATKYPTMNAATPVSHQVKALNSGSTSLKERRVLHNVILGSRGETRSMPIKSTTEFDLGARAAERSVAAGLKPTKSAKAYEVPRPFKSRVTGFDGAFAHSVRLKHSGARNRNCI